MDWFSDKGRQIIKRIVELRNYNKQWVDVANIINEEFGESFNDENVRYAMRYRARDYNNPQYDKVSVSNDASGMKVWVNNGRRIKTVEDLIVERNIDMKKWRVAGHWTINREVQFIDKAGKAHIENLAKVSARFVPVTLPEPELPQVQPIKIKVKYKAKVKAKPDKTLKKALIIPDSQNGFRRDMDTGKLNPMHDRRAWDICLQMADLIKPDIVIMLGDMIDFTEWTDKFIKSPDFYFMTQPTLVETAWWFAALRKAVGDSDIIYIPGNHELRLSKALLNNIMYIYGLRSADNVNGPPIMSLENMLGLKDIGVDVVGEHPDGKYYINKKLCARHSDVVSQIPGGTARKMLDKVWESTLIGHCHRLEQVSKTIHTNNNPEIISVYSLGTIAKIDGTVPAREKENNWQQGFGVVYYRDNGFHDVRMVPINNGHCIWNDMEITGTDRAEQIMEETNWKEGWGRL